MLTPGPFVRFIGGIKLQFVIPEIKIIIFFDSDDAYEVAKILNLILFDPAIDIETEIKSIALNNVSLNKNSISFESIVVELEKLTNDPIMGCIFDISYYDTSILKYEQSCLIYPEYLTLPRDYFYLEELKKW